jgi:hypothetical protein
MRWRRVGSRRRTEPPPRTRAWVEELEPRNLLATSTLGGVLSSPLSGPPPTFSPGLVQSATPGSGLPSGSQTTPSGSGSTSGFNAGNNSSGAAGQNQPVLTNPTGGPANGTLAGNTTTPANPSPNQPGTTPGTNPRSLPTGAVLTAGLLPYGALAGRLSPTEAQILASLGRPGLVGVPYVQPNLALVSPGPGTTVTSPNFYTNAPQYFDMATHTLLFAVGGPNPPNSEEPADGYRDPRLFRENGVPPRAPGSTPTTPRPVRPAADGETAWPAMSALFFREDPVASDSWTEKAVEAGSAGLAAAESARLVEQESPEARPAALAAVAGLGLLGGPSWRKEERRRGPAVRRRTPRRAFR